MTAFGAASSHFYSLLHGLRAGAAATRQEYYFRRSLLPPPQPSSWPIELPVEGRYIVSSDRGLYAVSRNRLDLLAAVPAFGFARAGERFYVATWRGRSSFVLSGSAEALLAGRDCGWQEIYSVDTQSDAGRIHQIAAHGDALWLANTALNTLTKINRHNGSWMANIAPFLCAHGHPIIVDHNHVNSLFPQERYLLFTAFRINRRAAFGLVGDGRAQVFAYRNMGVHDCIITGGSLIFSDSYRFWDGGGGCVVIDGSLIDPSYFDETAAHFVRGIAGEGDEMLIGNSYAGDRQTRFLGNGSLMLARGGKVTHAVAVPFAQVYDILREDGTHFDRAAGPASFGEASALLAGIFGPAVEEFALKDLLVGRSGKKFAPEDIGEIGEYLGR
jgi:hypothetical protein